MLKQNNHHNKSLAQNGTIAQTCPKRKQTTATAYKQIAVWTSNRNKHFRIWFFSLAHSIMLLRVCVFIAINKMVLSRNIILIPPFNIWLQNRGLSLYYCNLSALLLPISRKVLIWPSQTILMVNARENPSCYSFVNVRGGEDLRILNRCLGQNSIPIRVSKWNFSSNGNTLILDGFLWLVRVITFQLLAFG